MVFDDVRRIIAEQLEIDEDTIELDSKLVEDLGADSIDVVEFIIAFESEFDTEIDEDEVENITTVKDIVEYIKQSANLE